MKAKLFSTTIAIIFLAIGFQSCHKTTTPATPKTAMDNLKIPDGFTFESTQLVPVTIKMPTTVSFEAMRSRFDIYTGNPADGGKFITSGSFDQKGEYSGEIRVPTALQEIYVRTLAGSVVVSIDNNGGKKEGGVIINFGDDYGTSAPDTTEPTSFKSALANQSSLHYKSIRTTNLIGNGDFESGDFGQIHYWSTLHPVDGRWYFTHYYSEDMSRFDDMGNYVIRTPYANNYYFGGASQMIDANPGDLITFSADIKSTGNKNNLYVWLYLIPVDANNNALDYYYVYYYKPAQNWTTKTIAATMPSGTVSVNVLIWTWDLAKNSSVSFDNVMVTGPVTDADGDGVDDDLDDYPNDATRAFNVYYPNQTDWGTFAYEDLWPGTGDYDFNDLVLDYHFKSVLNSSNELVEFFTDYSVRAVGASLENGFGFMLGGDPTAVASVSGTHFTENFLNLNANGTEQKQTNTVVMLFDNAFNMIGSSGSTFINTKPGIAYVDPDTNQLHVVYQTPQSVETTGTAPYNPFIIVNKERGKEVHLAGQEPTDLADPTLFGTWADDSDPATGKYYQTVNNLPWAIDLPVSFDYPVEQVEILNAYNYFGAWAESGGVDYPDWYEEHAGYRVAANIYTPPTK